MKKKSEYNLIEFILIWINNNIRIYTEFIFNNTCKDDNDHYENSYSLFYIRFPF